MGEDLMPFQSEAQRRYMFANHPDIAKRWAREYGTPKNLPYHKGDRKGGHMAKRKVRFSDVANQMKGGPKNRVRGKRAAPDGSNAMQTDRNELVTEHTSPAGVTKHGRHGRGSREVHMRKALDMLMKSKGKKSARAKA
jgi:hypothetical protein